MEPTPVTTPPPSPHPPRRFSLWRFTIGVLIVLIGLQLLAKNFGWNWTWSIDLGKFWPVFIILIGLSMFVRGRRAVLANVLMAILLVALFLGSGFLPGKPGTEINRTISIPTATAVTAATLELDLGAADLDVRGGQGDLVSGTFRSNITDLETSSTTSGERQLVRIGQKALSNRWWFGNYRNTLDLTLDDALPLNLDVDSGATDLNLDLTKLRVAELSVQAGASTIQATFGDLVDLATARVDAGASTITVRLPRTLGVQLNLEAGVSTKHLTDFREVSKNHYESNDFGTTTKKLDLTIKAGVSTITVEWR